MRQTIKCFVAAFVAVLMGVSAFAQVTTSSLNGQIADEAGEPLAGAAVIAVHTPSGTQYAAVANDNGRFVINGMRAGGPYKIEVSFIGMATIQYNDVTLKLGDPYEINPVMKVSNELDAVVLTAESAFGANQTGAGSNFGLGKIEAMPTVDRSIYDVVKFTPQATVNKDGGISIAGTSNRYNSFQIDGAVANDSFGLTKTGTNGGQTGANPVAMDAIEEIQVVVAPFDVRQSGFTGGAINAITKSGTNTVKGSFYGFFNNQDFIGTTAGPLDEGETRTKYETQTTQTYGFTVGAPIIKNKLFIFASGEYYRRNIPNIYTPANKSYEKSDLALKNPITYNGKQYGEYFTDELAQAVIDHYQKTYNPGEGFSETTAEHRPISQSINAMIRLDWNINDANKLMFRYQFMDAFQDKYSSDYKTYYFGNSSYKQSNQTHSFVAELNSRISDMVYNEFRATAVMVRDERSVPYKAASMYIKDNVTIDLGTEYSSGANSMASDTYTIEDNVMIYAGNHTITAGTHNEIYRFNNLFLQRAFGSYEFNSLADFFANKPSAFKYAYADPTVEGVDGPQWKATTWAAQFGLYAQDEWKPTANFTLTYGVRADMPILLNKPTANPGFNEGEIANKYNEYVGVTPKATVLWSPRVGFRWFIDKERKSLLRGGAGLFTGRIPFVWLSNAYNNTGMETKSVTVSNPAAGFPTTSDPYTDIILTGKASAGGKATINTLSENFKYPQVFRANIGFEQSFGQGWKFVFDGLYSKNLNNVFFKNLALSNNGKKVYPVNSSVAAYAPYYDIDKTYATVVALGNTNKGYTYTLSGQLQKHFEFGLDLMASYTYSHARSANDGISSVALSNWKQFYAVDTNTPDLSYSLYERPHKVMAVVSYTSPKYARMMQTTVSLTYEGSSGQRFSYTYKDDVDFNGDDGSGNGNSLIYVPTVEELTMMNWASPSDALKFENQIRSDKYLSSRRGQWSERFGGLQPFEHHFDLHIAQDFFYDKKSGRKVQVVVDFMNISNLLNRNWGLSYKQTLTRSPLVVSSLIKDAEGNMTPVYKYNNNDNYYADFSSRWRCQVGLRLTF